MFKDLKDEWHRLPLDNLKLEAVALKNDIAIYDARIIEYPRLAMTYRAKKSQAQELLTLIEEVITEKEAAQ